MLCLPIRFQISVSSFHLYRYFLWFSGIQIDFHVNTNFRYNIFWISKTMFFTDSQICQRECDLIGIQILFSSDPVSVSLAAWRAPLGFKQKKTDGKANDYRIIPKTTHSCWISLTKQRHVHLFVFFSPWRTIKQTDINICIFCQVYRFVSPAPLVCRSLSLLQKPAFT